MAAKSKKAKSFDAVLERMPGRLGWTIVRLPFDAAKLWGKRGQVRVIGEINGFAFSTSIFPTGDGKHYLLVNKKMQKGAHVQPGVKACFVMQPDTAERVVTAAAELLRVLRQSKQLAKFYDSLSPSMRTYIARWVDEPKQVESRKRRAEQIAERMMATLEAERELPPVIEIALRENPKAREGWRHMTPIQRRRELMGIFYYQNPDSRARRIAKTVELMLQHAPKPE
jgi:uncharacterized protein YdeI (YjbR/CyaY-like superfamily)